VAAAQKLAGTATAPLPLGQISNLCVSTHKTARVEKRAVKGGQSTEQNKRYKRNHKHDETAAHCSTLQHTATHCSTLQHTAAHCNTLQHIATHYNTLQYKHDEMEHANENN